MRLIMLSKSRHPGSGGAADDSAQVGVDDVLGALLALGQHALGAVEPDAESALDAADRDVSGHLAGGDERIELADQVGIGERSRGGCGGARGGGLGEACALVRSWDGGGVRGGA